MAGKILKAAVITVNVLLLLLGLLIAALGIWVLVMDYGIVKLSKIQDNGFYSNTLREPGLLETAAVICIAVGGVTVVVTALTFHGVRKESKCYLAVCCALLVTLTLMDVVVIILTGLMLQRIENDLHQSLWQGVRSHYDSVVTREFDFSDYLDRAQVQLECCGVNSPMDFKLNATFWTDKSTKQIPDSCCVQTSKSSYLVDDKFSPANPNCTSAAVNYYKQPCYNHIKDWLIEKTAVLLGVSGFNGFIKLVVCILDIVLLRHCKEDAPYNDL